MKEYHDGEKYKCTCPYCGHPIDAASSLDREPRAPEQGDFAMCCYCKGMCLFNKHGKLRAPRTAKERKQALAASGELAREIRRRSLH